MNIKLRQLGVISVFLGLGYFLGPLFWENMLFLMSRFSDRFYITGHWHLVILYIVLFSSFVFFLTKPQKKVQWQKSSSAYVAFIIALFAEMFGFPLSFYLLSSVGAVTRYVGDPRVAIKFAWLGFEYSMLLTSFIAALVSAIAGVLIILGWKGIYYGRKKKKLVTNGIYQYVRHPQYLGFMMIMTAWLLAWPTIPILLMYPFLMFTYYKLSLKEEKAVTKEFGKKYMNYKKKVPMFIPFWK